MNQALPCVRELTPPPDPEQACAALEGVPYRLFLDSAVPGAPLGRYSFLTADPVAVVWSKGSHREWVSESGSHLVEADTVLHEVRRWMAPFALAPREDLPPFQGGVAGYLAYEFGRALETLPSARFDDLNLPDVLLGVYDWVIAWDHAEQRAWVISTGIPATSLDERRTRAQQRLEMAVSYLTGGAKPPRRFQTMWPRPASPAPAHRVSEPRLSGERGLRSSFTPDGYAAAVSRVREYIAAGDVFQANISQRFELSTTASPWALYTRLRRRNASPFAAFLDFPDAAILSASPERFLRVSPDGEVETRPIKGTRPRGFGPEHDAHLGRELVESEKDQAENLMIVDLMRNDLSRVCRPGSVHVSELFALEHYATVHHLVSTVVGTLAPGQDALSMLQASFPGGSVTGAPKIRAMEIIADLEPSARGVYCGSIGYWSVTGALDTSIAIRTAVVRDGRVTVSAGGGVTYGSDPIQEYRETLDKARGMIDSLATPDGPDPRQP